LLLGLQACPAKKKAGLREGPQSEAAYTRQGLMRQLERFSGSKNRSSEINELVVGYYFTTFIRRQIAIS
jgi:hypothetical protein